MIQRQLNYSALHPSHGSPADPSLLILKEHRQLTPPANPPSTGRAGAAPGIPPRARVRAKEPPRLQRDRAGGGGCSPLGTVPPGPPAAPAAPPSVPPVGPAQEAAPALRPLLRTHLLSWAGAAPAAASRALRARLSSARRARHPAVRGGSGCGSGAGSALV